MKTYLFLSIPFSTFLVGFMFPFLLFSKLDQVEVNFFPALFFFILYAITLFYCHNHEARAVLLFRQKLQRSKEVGLHLRRRLYEYLNQGKINTPEKSDTLSKSFTRDDARQRTFDNVDCAFGDFTLHLKLKYPAITDPQLQLCCLVLTGADTSEISQQLDISKDNVRQRKTRLRDLMGIKNLNLDLRVVLQEFSQS